MGGQEHYLASGRFGTAGLVMCTKVVVPHIIKSPTLLSKELQNSHGVLFFRLKLSQQSGGEEVLVTRAYCACREGTLQDRRNDVTDASGQI